jgi:hypothetical protein
MLDKRIEHNRKIVQNTDFKHGKLRFKVKKSKSEFFTDYISREEVYPPPLMK